MRATKDSLPLYPIAMAKGKQILVIEANGDTTFLTDTTPRRARRAAKTVQQALRATSYAKQRLADAVDDVANDLIDLGVPTDEVDEIMMDAYTDIKEMILRLRETKTLLYLR